MQPPIPAGTILQNRYRSIGILGQGGFGRTYLAEDLGRFQERCALKELIPLQSSAYAIEKSKELFQREAAILYQIQHPQIPQFRATFEENQRLFLVQDYVEGKTYRTLLDERKAIGQTFSEAEVLEFLRQMLPVLAHIHVRGIVHRDISPDNIILRSRDRLPVLIDFGVVKELATRVQSSSPASPATTVGKAGYAPIEQMQTGGATPSSDLYALAVTAIVLLTGKEPPELLDPSTLTWNWQRWANVSLGFAYVLNRMLSRQPNDRYRSVSEVVQALDSQGNPNFQPQPTPPVPVAASSPSVSQVATVAIGRRPDPANPGPRQQPKPDPIPSTANGSIWDNPLLVTVLGAIVVIVTGLGSWSLVSSALNSQRERPRPKPPAIATPSPDPSPLPSFSPKPSPTPTPSPSLAPIPQLPPEELPPEELPPEISPEPSPEPSAIPTEEPSLELPVEPSPEPSAEAPPVEPPVQPSPELPPKPPSKPSPSPQVNPSPTPKPEPPTPPKPEPSPVPPPTSEPEPPSVPTPTPEATPTPPLESSSESSPTLTEVESTASEPPPEPATPQFKGP